MQYLIFNQIINMKRYVSLTLAVISWSLIVSCKAPEKEAVTETSETVSKRLPVILDTDANNELDDQHAIAYLFYNQDTFDIKGITVNTTMGGGNIDAQYAEAERIMKLCAIDSIPLLKGADKSFAAIAPTIGSPEFDGHAAIGA